MSDSTAPEALENYRKEIADRVQKHEAQSACRLNPDTRMVEGLIEGLVRRKVKFGDYYCPCRIVTGKADVDKLNVCPCVTHEDEIAQTGKCHCALFVGERKA
jgi:ferredoxin-thioredoxin reductase catalytic chain